MSAVASPVIDASLARVVAGRFPQKWAELALRAGAVMVVDRIAAGARWSNELWADAEARGSSFAFVFRLGGYLFFGGVARSRFDACPRCVAWSLALTRADIASLLAPPHSPRELPSWPAHRDEALLGEELTCLDAAGNVLRFPAIAKHPACEHGTLPAARALAVGTPDRLVDGRVGLVRRVWELDDIAPRGGDPLRERMVVAYADFVHPRLSRMAQAKREPALLNALGVDFGSAEKARLRATFEAFERIALYAPPERGPDFVGPSTAVGDADFRAEDFWAYAPDQLDGAFPYRNPTNAESLGWRRGVGPNGQPVLAPEDFVVNQSSMLRFHSLNSNGCAAHESNEAARESALVELVERHAFLVHWTTDRAPRAIPRSSLPEEEGEIVDLLEARGYRARLSDLSIVPGVRVAGVVLENREERHPKALVAAGAAQTIGSALTKALREAASQLALAKPLALGAPRPALDAALVKTPTDHGRFFHAPASFPHLGALVAERDPLSAEELRSPTVPARSSAELGRLLGEHGVRIAFFDIAPAALARSGVHVVRCVSPDLFPMAFGTGRLRLGGTQKGALQAVPRARTIPHPFP